MVAVDRPLQTMAGSGAALVLLATVACAESAGQDQFPGGMPDVPAGTEAAQECVPVESRPPNAGRQSPAFEGQTRACAVNSGVAFEVTVIASGLDHPWAVEPLPGGDFLVTERAGNMRIVSADGVVGPPLDGVPEVSARRQGGLLDVALGPGFATDRMIYWSYAEPRDGGNGTTVARGRLADDHRSVEGVEVVVRSRPTYDGGHHFGSRLAFGPGGYLFVTLGERSDSRMRPQAQNLDSHLGKILRVHPDGRAPADNPFVGQEGALPEIWSLGHRNVQSATLDPDGRLWTIEHGPRGGDELNLIEPGVNYGWPVQSYGEEYSGRPIRTARTQREGIRQPVYYWDPVIAPSGAEWYDGDAFPEWRGSLFVGALRQERLVRLTLEPDETAGPRSAGGWRVTGEEHFLWDRGQRIRDVRAGPDGALYVVTDEDRGELWRIAPR